MVLQICPYLRSLNLTVTDDLLRIGQSLQSNPNVTLDKVILNYGEDYTRLIPSLSDFLICCGQRINILALDCSGKTFFTFNDLSTIAENCPLLDCLEIANLQMQEDESSEALALPSQPLSLRFLTRLKLSHFAVEPFAREICLFILTGCPDLETCELEFADKAWFFSDFLLDEILSLNPLPRLESFLIQNASLTLISALRLLNARSKLRRIGRILQWDVELSELETFGQIIKRAKSLKLLHEDVIFL